MRAERRLGEMIKEVPKNEGRAATGPRGTKTEPRKRDQQPPTLAEVGLTKKQSSKAQKIADVLYDSRYDLFSACNARTVNNSDYRQ